jgi:leucyl/phenylalanyl-tRNA---protein transferase
MSMRAEVRSEVGSRRSAVSRFACEPECTGIAVSRDGGRRVIVYRFHFDRRHILSSTSDLRPPTTLPSPRFPPADSADAEGLVFVGGALSPDWLLEAYRHGIFPWPIVPRLSRMQWWSPNPRAIFELDRFHVSRRLERTCRSGRFTVTSDRDFAGVMAGCATAQSRRWNTWLTSEMTAAYQRLFECGHAHSIEVWHERQLAGGTYGVTIGGLYAGESMFYRVRDASKVALTYLMRHLRGRGYRLFDIQQLTEHTQSLGATEIRRSDYLRRLAEAVRQPVEFGSMGAGSKC